MSPPRQRKPASAVAGTERKFSWATQRITELTHELETAQKHIKVTNMVMALATASFWCSPQQYTMAVVCLTRTHTHTPCLLLPGAGEGRQGQPADGEAAAGFAEAVR